MSDINNALEVLRSFPKNSLVADFYDEDFEFSSALTKVFGDSFEYPDFSHLTMDRVVKKAEKEIAVLKLSNNSGVKSMTPAKQFKVSTADLMGHQMNKTLHAELFDYALKKSFFEKNMLNGFGENSTSQCAVFYFSDAVAPLIFDGVQSSPRIVVTFIDAHNAGFGATGVNMQSAKVEIDIEFNGRHHGRGPVQIKLNLPDRLLGLENVFKRPVGINSVASTYNGLLFNNTPTKLNCNLYDVFNFVGAAFARGLELDRSQNLNLNTFSTIESISSALDDLAGVEMVSSGSYFGAVKAVTTSVVVQNAGRGRMVGHQVSRFGEVLPSVGEVVDLTHKDGRVSFVAQQEKGADKGR